MSTPLSISLITVALVLGIMIGFGISQIPGEKQKISMLPISNSYDDPSASSVYTDTAYIKDMITHHETAISMAKRVHLSTKRDSVRDMATTVIDADSKDILKLKGLLSSWYE